MSDYSRQQLAEAAAVLRAQQERFQLVAQGVRLREAREQAALAPVLREAKKEFGKRIARSFGLRPDQKQGRKILVEGRRAFDPEYNSLDRGARLGAGETLGLRG
ncbi:MAG: hypothetical protein ACLQU1_34355 [Bryobacteraceae bacterium]